MIGYKLKVTLTVTVTVTLTLTARRRQQYICLADTKTMHMNRGCYTAMRRNEFYFWRCRKQIIYEWAQRMSKILFSPPEGIIRILILPYVMFSKWVVVLYQCIQTRVLGTSICVHWYRTDTNFVNYLSNDLKQSCFQITFKKSMLKTCEKSFSKSGPLCISVYRHWLNMYFFSIILMYRRVVNNIYKDWIISVY